MPLEESARLAKELADHGYTADREAITLLTETDDSGDALRRAVEAMPDDAFKLSTDHVRTVLNNQTGGDRGENGSHDGDAWTNSSVAEVRNGETPAPPDSGARDDSVRSPQEQPLNSGDGGDNPPISNPSISTATADTDSQTTEGQPPDETEGSGNQESSSPAQAITISNDMTGQSTGTGQYQDFVKTFRDRYDRLSRMLHGRVTHRNAGVLESRPGGGEAGMIGMITDIRSTTSGHWLIELEDTTGVFPCLIMRDKAIADLVPQLLMDEVVGVEGTLADDGEILFVDDLSFPNIPRTFEPSTADRHVQAALISDIHVGSQEFMTDAWQRFCSWLHTDEAANIEYLLIAGDMVEGVGIYPGQDTQLEIVDIFDQYEEFSEHLKDVPGDMEIVMIPGNHDAVRLAEPQPGFDEELRDILTAHDAHVASNPAVVTIENVSILMYHGVSLDEIIAEFPDDLATYADPHQAMYQLLKKRHVAPQFGGHTRLSPEEQDYLVIDEVPDVFHTGHVHKLGIGQYRNVVAVNSGCWQSQTDFQKSVNLDPDTGYAPLLDLDTLEMQVYKFT